MCLNRFPTLGITSEKAAVFVKRVGCLFNDAFLPSLSGLDMPEMSGTSPIKSIEVHFKRPGTRRCSWRVGRRFGHAHLQPFREPLIEEQREQCSEFGKRAPRWRAERVFRMSYVPCRGDSRRSAVVSLLAIRPIVTRRPSGNSWPDLSIPGSISSDWRQDDLRSIQKGSQIPLDRMVLAVDAEQSLRFGHEKVSSPASVGVVNMKNRRSSP